MVNICWRFHRDDLRSFFPNHSDSQPVSGASTVKNVVECDLIKEKNETNFELHLTNENVECLMDQAGRTNAAGSRFSCGRTCLRLSLFWSTRKSFPDIWLKLIMLPFGRASVMRARSLASLPLVTTINHRKKLIAHYFFCFVRDLKANQQKIAINVVPRLNDTSL